MTTDQLWREILAMHRMDGPKHRRETLMAEMLSGHARLYGTDDDNLDADDLRAVKRARMLADAIMEAAR